MVLALVDLVSYPVKMHVNGLGAFLLDIVIGNTSGCGIVSLNGCGMLVMSKFLQGNAQGTSMFGIEEECTKFSLSCTCYDWSHFLAKDINGPIVWWWCVHCCR